MSNENTIAALLIERAGYERRGLADRVKAVDASLVAAGYEAPRPQRDASVSPTEARGRRTTKG